MGRVSALWALAFVGLAGADEIQLKDANGTLVVKAVAGDVLRVDYVPNGVKPKPTEILDPKGLHRARAVGKVDGMVLKTDKMNVEVKPDVILIFGEVEIERGPLAKGIVTVKYLPQLQNPNVYGIRGIELGGSKDSRVSRAHGLTRNEGGTVSGSAQGDGGSPLAYTTAWGLFVDSVDGNFDGSQRKLTFNKGSRKDVEAYVVIGPPKRSIEVATQLTGRPPMFPKWGLGFLNSQWKTDEKEITDIVATYRRKQIPLDCFIMDFDFKAWGEDNYGEFRWNSTNGPGNVGGNKFPNGQNGGFGKAMAAQGVHLGGIMKPRVLVENTEHKPTKVAAEASALGYFMPKKPYTDYFSHRLANDFDFSKPEMRKWYWKYARNLFDTGISGWWNDEADDGFDSLGFFHMQQSLYDGQRSTSGRRVWSLNRNFYAGAQRFAFGTWSGDIGTGFGVMRDQMARMLTILDLAQPHWSMDTGGFGGHPSPENYARWMEFAAVCPIMRVHCTYGEHRQPWVYGPVAEAAAKKAIEFRYSMLPSLYSWEREANLTGVGVVRPLFWEFPGEADAANVMNEWMLGENLLVSPVMDEGEMTKDVMLPKGKWFDLATDQVYGGEQLVRVATDSKGWSDIPIFVREGSILARQEVLQYVGEKPVKEITLDVWPSLTRVATFNVYDDDGETYGYERGGYFEQKVTASFTGDKVKLTFGKRSGSYRTPLASYRVRIHRMTVAGVTWNGKQLKEMTVPAGQAGELIVQNGYER